MRGRKGKARGGRGGEGQVVFARAVYGKGTRKRGRELRVYVERALF